MPSNYFMKFGELLAFICLLAEPSTSSERVECIYYNSEICDCTWSRSDGTPNYTMYYWYSANPAQECGSYIQENGYNIGCKFTKDDVQEFTPLHLQRVPPPGSQNVPLPPNQTFWLQNQVKPNPPANLTVNSTANNGLSLAWRAPMIQHCMEYEIKYKSNKDKDWQTESVLGEQTTFPIPSVDPKKLYTFKVRAKVNSFCGSCKLWSEWSSSVTWGSSESTESLGYANLEITLIPGLIGLSLLFLVFILRSERLKVIIIPKIPNPERRFDSLFDNFGGNFQDWLGVPKDTLEGFKLSYQENACPVSEPPPYSEQDTQPRRPCQQYSERLVVPGTDPGHGGGGGQPETLFIVMPRSVENNRYGINENIYSRV